MSKIKGQKILQIVVLVISIGLMVWASPEMMKRFGWKLGMGKNEATSFIVQGEDIVEISNHVLREGGVITRTFPARNAVVAQLTIRQLKALLNTDGIFQIYQSQPRLSLNTAAASVVSSNG